MTLERRFGPQMCFSPADGNAGIASEPSIPPAEIKENQGITVIKRQTHLSPFLNSALYNICNRYGVKPSNALKEAADKYALADLRWGTNRRTKTQPYLDPKDASGFEGYFTKKYNTPVPMVKHLVANAKEVLDCAWEDIGGKDLDHVLAVMQGKDFSLPGFQYAEQIFLVLRELVIADTNIDTARIGENPFSEKVRSLVEKHGVLRFSTDDPNGVVQNIELPEKGDIVQLTQPRLSSEQLKAILGSEKDLFTWEKVISLAGQSGHSISRLLSEKLDYDRRHEEELPPLSSDPARYELFVARMNARQAGIKNLPLIPLKHG